MSPPISDQITFIYTTDMAAAIDFYEEKLQLPLALDQGGCRIYRVTGNAFIGVCRRPKDDIHPPDPRKRGVILTLVTEDVDAWHARLKDAGVAFDAPPAHNDEYEIYHTYLRDPSGYLIEIQRFDNPDWAAR